MLFTLLVLSFINVDVAANRFKIDCHARYDQGWFGDRDALVQDFGTTCELCVKNGIHGHTACKQGPSETQEYWYAYFDYSHVSWDTWIWTNCDDALIIDQAWLYDTNDDRSHWGDDNGYMWCMSEDYFDYDDWEGFNGANRCYRLLEFAADGLVYYYHDFFWTPDGRRAMQDAGNDENVPTAADFNACEADETKTHEQCEDLVDLIFQNVIAHPERKEKLIGQEHHELSTNFCPNIDSNTECDESSDCFWFSLGSDDGTCEEDNHENVQKKMYMRTSALLKLFEELGSSEDNDQTGLQILLELLHLQTELAAELSSSETGRRSLEKTLERTVVEGARLRRKL